jgi:hypothetical protein
MDTRDFPGRDEHPIAGPCRRQPHNPLKEDTMSTIDMGTETQVQLPETGTVEFKLEVGVGAGEPSSSSHGSWVLEADPRYPRLRIRL